MLARNSLLARLAASAASFAASSSSLAWESSAVRATTRSSRCRFIPASSLLAGREVVHHGVEGAGQLADLAGALDDGALGEVAAGDALGGLRDGGERAGRDRADADHHQRAGQEDGEAHQRGRSAGRLDHLLQLLEREAEVQRAERPAVVALDARGHPVVAARALALAEWPAPFISSSTASGVWLTASSTRPASVHHHEVGQVPVPQRALEPLLDRLACPRRRAPG